MQTSLRSWSRRLSLVVASVTVATLAYAAPAEAYENITIIGAEDEGRMTFNDHGDVSTLCDSRGDTRGVVARCSTSRWAATGTYRKPKPKAGDAGCDNMPHDVNVGDYQMKLYGSGIEVAKSRVFNE